MLHLMADALVRSIERDSRSYREAGQTYMTEEEAIDAGW